MTINTNTTPRMLQTGHNRWPALYDLKKMWHPEWFQSNRKRKNFFEGWYIKNVSVAEDETLSFIPGVSFNEHDAHAFVQVISNKTDKPWYFKYPLGDFSYATDRFAASINRNFFSASHINVDLKDDNNHIFGNLSFQNQVRYPSSLSRPGIMGWYRYVPFMECYHGVVSLDHDITGSIEINGTKRSFDGGKGYIEKDWGRSMPESWIWMQSNNFDQEKTSFMLSVARIPWLRSYFTGFLGFFINNDQTIHFATYTGARINQLEHVDNQLTLTIAGKNYYLHVRGEKEPSVRSKGGLKAPDNGQMNRVIHESVDSKIYLALTDKQGKPLFEGVGNSAGLEIVGDTSLLAG